MDNNCPQFYPKGVQRGRKTPSAMVGMDRPIYSIRINTTSITYISMIVTDGASVTRRLG
ncbi:hypothetical protein IC006_1618 [Sulfuracidifex tepidarius]|uniref:Uncharacterized protein n=1 Tax=Sulfuracidifex tepidarius TaxID=1294262 RepID=A0A510DWF4_9CREN|nr:hypothetical protein IC006_1618 [Sulfuracidifex tepidarius]BBG27065.1 hypothetical protein IC007_1595 [Sulfuracidifex tepidarius]